MRPSAEERYHTDAMFRTLVDWMQHFIEKADYTPSELREAAILAAIRHEEHMVRRVYYVPGDILER